MRKLVTKRTISELKPIEGADNIVAAVVDGWEVVVKKGEFNEGDECVFFEIDSFLPANDPRYEFLHKTGIKQVDGIGRIRLRSVRLRKQLSQGLALPINLFPEVVSNDELEDYSEVLNVTKYERPEPKAPGAAGNFPSWIRKTDEERIQNIQRTYERDYSDVEFVPTLKLDGTSTTLSFLLPNQADKWLTDTPDTNESEDSVGEVSSASSEDVVSNQPPKFINVDKDGIVGQFILCSRNLMIRFNPDSHYTKAVQPYMDALAKMATDLGESIALQGETMGEGIQGNPEQFSKYEFFAFNLYSIDRGEYFSFDKSQELLNKYGIQGVPVLGEPVKVFKEFKTVNDFLTHAEGKSINAQIREGVVWKSVGITPPVSFKAISNEFLLKVEGNQ